MSFNRNSPGLAAAAAITLALAASNAGASGFQLQPIFTDPPASGPGGLADGLPDITIGVGYIDGKKWTDGGVIVLDSMGPVIATRAGPQQNMCRFNQFDYQPGNQGTVNATGSTALIYRDNIPVKSDGFPNGYLFAGGWTPFKKWEAELKEGMNTIKVVMDANKQVSESNEGNNSFVAKLNVQLDCDGDGKINGIGGFKVEPSKPGPGSDPATKSRKLRLKPRG
ncbi:hypothetical protein HBA54_28010 [Pelagibius litoralis]|uniref:CARDB domain-containing protein n=1 Tax=Pelagibius litoralis TaxID=374515 RepID=A0A967F3R4_9PROT|nr:CARDB domain-containing protein [Pelagibius litoralis]NIA72439.1 hypothetical protein [Pelagibius litoralis]